MHVSTLKFHFPSRVPEKDENLASDFDKLAPVYPHFVSDSKYHPPEWILSKLHYLPNATPIDPITILDLGCGDGIIATIVRLNNPNCIFEGMDFSDKMLQKIQKSELNCFTALYKSDLRKQIPDKILYYKTYNVIFALGLFEYIPRLAFRLLLIDTLAMLPIGGKFFFTVEADDSHTTPRAKANKTAHTEDSLRKYLSHKNIEILSLENALGYYHPETLQPVNYLYVIVKKLSLLPATP